MMKNMTAEQAEQRQALIDLGLLASVVDEHFQPNEFAELLQDMLVEELFPEDDERSEDEGDY